MANGLSREYSPDDLWWLLASAVEPGDEKVGAHLAEHGLVETVMHYAKAQTAVGERLRVAVQLLPTQVLPNGVRFIHRESVEWPAQLHDLELGEPLGLWVRGQADVAELTAHSMAIVGARAATAYGERSAGELASTCGDWGITTVSGAAYGIDAAVHRGSLAVDGPTIAVLACGVDVAYPRAHHGLLERITETGLIISEAPLKTSPMKHRFLTRNRLIAGLSSSTVVVEAALRSGSLSTSMWAHEMGRQVWGIPGPITSAASAGVHAAIRDGVMDIVTDVNECVSLHFNKNRDNVDT